MERCVFFFLDQQIEADSGRQLTYSEVLDLVERASYHLQSQGVQRGDVFALCAQNSATYVILVLALARLGAVFALINHLTTSGTYPQGRKRHEG